MKDHEIDQNNHTNQQQQQQTNGTSEDVSQHNGIHNGNIFQVEMARFIEKITEMHSKIEQIVQRVDQFDKRIGNIEKMANEARNPDSSISIEINKLAKANERLNNKITIFETDLLSMKQVKYFQ